MPARNSSNRTAAEWIARLNADDVSRRDATAFRDWLAANPDHATRFERATDVWDMVPGTTSRSPSEASPSEASPAEASSAEASSAGSASAGLPVVSRRRAMAGITALVVTAAGGTVAVQSAYAATPYETGIGEQRRIALGDGSTMLLDAATRVRVIATPDRRRLWLKRGRIDLSVASMATPFRLDAGGDEMTARAGRFDLRRDEDDRVAMTAIAGRAVVSTATAPVILNDGDRMRNGGAVDRPDLAVTQAWTSGRAAFHDDTLQAVADEANRYSVTRLVIADRAAAERRVSGMYRTGDTLALARSLAALLSLRVRTVQGAVLLGG